MLALLRAGKAAQTLIPVPTRRFWILFLKKPLKQNIQNGVGESRTPDFLTRVDAPVLVHWRALSADESTSGFERGLLTRDSSQTSRRSAVCARLWLWLALGRGSWARDRFCGRLYSASYATRRAVAKRFSSGSFVRIPSIKTSISSGSSTAGKAVRSLSSGA